MTPSRFHRRARRFGVFAAMGAVVVGALTFGGMPPAQAKVPRYIGKKVTVRPGQLKRVSGLRVKLKLEGTTHRPTVGRIGKYALTWEDGKGKDEAHLTSDHMCMEHRSFGMLVQAWGLRGGDHRSKLTVQLLAAVPKKVIGEDKANDIAYRAAKKARHPTTSSAMTEANGCYAVVFRGIESKTEIEIQVGAHTGKVLDVIKRPRR